MEINKDIKSLASYVTYRQLYDDGKRDVYFVIAKFAENIIMSHDLYSFGLTELTECIRSQFGFNIPDYVVQSAIRRLKYVTRNNNVYVVDASLLPADDGFVSNSIENAENLNEKLINALVNYVENKKGTLNNIEKRHLTSEFCSFLLDNVTVNGYSELISAFILENEGNHEFQKHLLQIKEGAVLFAGLNYNSDVSDNSAWKEEIVIYVENEILFHLAGYNGSVFQKLAEELLQLIDEMNRKSKKKNIHIRYFEEVYEEINSFFDKAIDIVEGRDHVTVENYAMVEIVKGCHSAADVIDKKANFYTLLRNKMISKEKPKNYYLEQYHEYNLESPEAIDKYKITDDKLRYIKHLNYVNVLRKGVNSNDLRKCQYIVLTETGKMLRMATEFCDKPEETPLVVNMNILTNRLWYDLNKGFGAKEFPATFDIVIKSRIVLSKILTKNVADKFEETKKKYYKKEIDENQLADNILFLREEVKRPEDIKADVLDEVLSFISEKQLEIYQSEKELLENRLQHSEQEKAALVEAIRQKDKETRKIRKAGEEEKESLQRLNEELVAQRKTDIEGQIRDTNKRKGHADKKINRRIQWFKLLLAITIISYYAVVLCVFIKSDVNIQEIISIVLAILPPAISVIISLIVEKRFDILEILKRITNYQREKITMKIYSEYSIDIEQMNELQNALEDINGQVS